MQFTHARPLDRKIECTAHLGPVDVVGRVGKVTLDRDVVHVSSEPVVPELLPLAGVDMEHERVAQEQVPHAHRRRLAAHVEEVSAGVVRVVGSRLEHMYCPMGSRKEVSLLMSIKFKYVHLYIYIY